MQQAVKTRAKTRDTGLKGLMAKQATQKLHKLFFGTKKAVTLSH
jgi:hypothetical protein